MSVYTQTPSSDTLEHALGELQAGVEGNAELSEHVEVITDALKRSLPALPRVIWEANCGRGRYRVVVHRRPGESEPAGFSIERGHRDCMGEWSYNRCGGTPNFVFKCLLKDYCRLLDANRERGDS